MAPATKGAAPAGAAASTPSSAAIPPPSLTLPPSQFARLQPHAYLLAHLSPPPSSNQPPIRANGRSPLEFRVASANAGSLTHTNGSAVVRVGDTAAVCGVRAEILHTEDIASWSVSSSSGARKRRKTESDDSNDDINDDDDQIRDLDLLVPNLSLSTGCAPGFIPGAPPSALAQSLSHQILSLLHTSRLVRADDLRIWYQPPDLSAIERERTGEERMNTEEEGDLSGAPAPEIKGFWVLYIDVLIISLAGNPFDAAWAAVVAALRDTKLPKAWWDVDTDMVLCSDEVSEAKKLTLRGMPVASSYCVFEADAAANWRAVVIPHADADAEEKKETKPKRWILADPDGFEENLCQERICLVMDQDHRAPRKTKILSMEKNGGLSVGKEELRNLVDVSAKRWAQVKGVLEGL
jgi:exosome complex component RRP43